MIDRFAGVEGDNRGDRIVSRDWFTTNLIARIGRNNRGNRIVTSNVTGTLLIEPSEIYHVIVIFVVFTYDYIAFHTSVDSANI